MSGASRPKTHANRASAFLGRDGVERGWALFYVLALAMRTHELAFFVLGKREKHSEVLLALLT